MVEKPPVTFSPWMAVIGKSEAGDLVEHLGGWTTGNQHPLITSIVQELSG